MDKIGELNSSVNQAQLIEDGVIDANHRCPNADLAACEFCKLLNIFAITARTYILKNDLMTAQLLQDIHESVTILRRIVDEMIPHLARFDFDEGHHHNGYRSYVQIARIGVMKCRYLGDHIYDSRNYTPNSQPVIHEKLVDWRKIFRVLVPVLSSLKTCMLESNDNTCLLTSNKEVTQKLAQLSHDKDSFVAFQGRLIGFQFCKSVRQAVAIVNSFMASFANVYKSDSIFKNTTLISPTDFLYYWKEPQARAQRVVKILGDDPLMFFKEFWNVQERGLLKIVSNCLGDPVESNIELALPPVKLMVATKLPQQKLTVLPPIEYFGRKAIQTRLLSHKMRPGTVGSGRKEVNTDELCKTLVVHCHGGGFVATSSNAHLVYLKTWAKGIGAPILSIDYSLSPEAPYPRALHEAFYAYVWALENATLLGSSAEKVILAGDSAGGLLLTGVTILCIELGIRIPDGLLLVYSPQLLISAVSPARVLSYADPLIPYPALAACLGAYMGPNFDPSYADLPGAFVAEQLENIGNIESVKSFTTIELDELSNVHVPADDWHLSPLIAPDAILSQFPATSVVSTTYDPTLDDSIEFAKRLKNLDIPVTLDVINSVQHGFLNFAGASDECHRGMQQCVRRLKDFIEV